MNERVKELRKALGLTLDKFGARLGVGKTAISKIEKGENNLTDQMFLSICREYNVNPGWLETGNGPMFCENSDDNDYMLAASKLSDDPLVTSCLIEYAKLQPDERDIVRKYIDNLIKRCKEEDAT
ncbi:MAG: helix-turn-helix transcriptional regulator [Clostridium sp.]|nr:helix-turn-helix transcriptional regulator [Clostridium sp.]